MVLRGPVRLLLAAACALVLTSCGTTTYVDTNVGGKQPMSGAGWQGIEPVAIELPTGDPVSADQPGLPTDADAPVLVNIWASFCEPCKEELPLLQEVDDSGQLRVVGFTRDNHRDRASEALSAAGVTFANWMDTDAKVALSLDGRVPLNGIPSSVLVRDGKAVAVHIGPFPDKTTILAALEIR